MAVLSSSCYVTEIFKIRLLCCRWRVAGHEPAIHGTKTEDDDWCQHARHFMDCSPDSCHRSPHPLRRPYRLLLVQGQGRVRAIVFWRFSKKKPSSHQHLCHRDHFSASQCVSTFLSRAREAQWTVGSFRVWWGHRLTSPLPDCGSWPEELQWQRRCSWVAAIVRWGSRGDTTNASTMWRPRYVSRWWRYDVTEQNHVITDYPTAEIQLTGRSNGHSVTWIFRLSACCNLILGLLNALNSPW